MCVWIYIYFPFLCAFVWFCVVSPGSNLHHVSVTELILYDLEVVVGLKCSKILCRWLQGLHGKCFDFIVFFFIKMYCVCIWVGI